MIPANAKQEFVEKNFHLHRHGQKWFDLVGIVHMDADRLAKLEIVELGTADSFAAIRVTIASRKTGPIDEKVFRFNDYLKNDTKNRADKREDYKGSFYIWAHGGEFDWYIAVPKSTMPLTDAIDEYISLWK